MCGALGVSRGGFYAWLTRPRSQRSRSDEELGAKVRTSFLGQRSNRGQVHALNKGLQRATGDWVGWQNSDDFYLPGAFESFAAATQRYPDADIVVADIVLVDEAGAPIRDVRYVKPTYESVFAEGMLLAN